MDALDEFKSGSPLRSPSFASSRAQESMRTIKTPQSLSRSPTGRTSPLFQLEMSVTEQIARKTRKSTVLDQKNALMVLAIPDYDDYKIIQPYSCRSLSNKSKFVGGCDFITRHNPQEVNDFKIQYSRDVGNLGRHRSVLAPPNTLLAGDSPLSPSSSGKSLKMAASQTISRLVSNQQHDGHESGVWRRVLASGKKPCWVLTEQGINELIGPEYCIASRLPLTTTREEPTPRTNRSPLRPETPLASYSGRDSARIGYAVDVTDEASLAALSRTAMYSPASHAPTPPRSPYRDPAVSTPKRDSCRTPSSRSNKDSAEARFACGLGSLTIDADTSSPAASRLSPLQTRNIFHVESSLSPACATASPTLLAFAMEVSPPCITLNNLMVGEVYLFPVRVRNVGTNQERFRVKRLSVSTGTYPATIAEAQYDKDTARLAPGLAAIVTVTLSFAHRGRIAGQLCVDTENVGSCDVRIEGTVR